MDDLISRQAAIALIQSLYPAMPRIDFMDNISHWRKKYAQYIECENAIKKLPSAQKHGKWIHDDFGWHCSECWVRYPDEITDELNFCPNCGADMRGGTDAAD